MPMWTNKKRLDMPSGTRKLDMMLTATKCGKHTWTAHYSCSDLHDMCISSKYLIGLDGFGNISTPTSHWDWQNSFQWSTAGLLLCHGLQALVSLLLPEQGMSEEWHAAEDLPRPSFHPEIITIVIYWISIVLLETLQTQVFGEAHGTYVGPGESEVALGLACSSTFCCSCFRTSCGRVHHGSCWGFHQLPSGLVTELSPLIGMIASYRKVAPSLATPARARHPFPVVALRLNLMVAESNIWHSNLPSWRGPGLPSLQWCRFGEHLHRVSTTQ